MFFVPPRFLSPGRQNWGQSSEAISPSKFIALGVVCGKSVLQMMRMGRMGH
uniref:MIP08107p n=1 Tax=Drosophila melanogaster TaxID=7227 RepID=C0PV31_DROME|nr:MIP08107p [Drosophila melanogaster]